MIQIGRAREEPVTPAKCPATSCLAGASNAPLLLRFLRFHYPEARGLKGSMVVFSLRPALNFCSHFLG